MAERQDFELIEFTDQMDFRMFQFRFASAIFQFSFGALFILCGGWVSAQESDAAYQPLGLRLKQAVQSMNWGGGHLTLLVEEEKFAEKIYAEDASHPAFFGGLMKFYTAGAALELLGPEYQFKTTLSIGQRTVPNEDHRLRDETFLVISGTGDPTMMGTPAKDYRDPWSTFDRWGKLLRDRKIRQIDGPIVALADHFDDQWYGLGWPDIPRGNTMLPSVAALNFNGNCMDVFFKKGKKIREPAEYEIFPELQGYLYFTSRVTIFPPPVSPIKLERVTDGNMVVAYGHLPPKTTAHVRVSIEDPARFYAEALKTRLNEQKIKVNGEAVSIYRRSEVGLPLEQLELLDEIKSPTLDKILPQMILEDRTLEAEVIFKSLGVNGRKTVNTMGSFDAGGQAVLDWLSDLRLSANGLIMVDGSGRSVINRTTAESLLALLRRIDRHDSQGTYRGMFPKMGEGNLKNRMHGIDARSLVQGMASSSLSDEEPAWESIGGWIERPGKSNLLFCMAVQGSSLKPLLVRDQMDQLLKIMTE